MSLYLNISWLEIYCAAADKKLGILYLHGPPKDEFGIENYTQVTDLFGGHDFLPIEIDAKLGDWTGFDISGHK